MQFWYIPERRESFTSRSAEVITLRREWERGFSIRCSRSPPENILRLLERTKTEDQQKEWKFDPYATCKRTQQIPTLLGQQCWGVVASVLAVVCKWMHRLPTILGPAVDLGKDTTYTTLETMCNARVAPTILEELEGRAVQTDPTLLRYASAITRQKLLPQKFYCFQALRNDSPSAKRRNNVASICTELNEMWREIFKDNKSFFVFNGQIIYNRSLIFCLISNLK